MKLKEEEEAEDDVFDVRRKECNEVAANSSCKKVEEQGHGRVASVDKKNTKQDSTTCQNSEEVVVDGNDDECMSTEKMTITNPGAADSTPYARRQVGIAQYAFSYYFMIV